MGATGVIPSSISAPRLFQLAQYLPVSVVPEHVSFSRLVSVCVGRSTSIHSLAQGPWSKGSTNSGRGAPIPSGQTRHPDDGRNRDCCGSMGVFLAAGRSF